MPARQDPITGRYIYVPFQGYEYRTYYEEAGQGVPLVCLHTAGTDGREWRHQLCDSDITRDFRVIAFDLPHHGKSIPRVGFQMQEYRLTADFYAGFIKAFCDALDLERPVIMGSSMGGNVCLQLAYRYPGSFRAFLAVEAALYSPGWFLDILDDPRVHGGEVCATSVFGLMAPQSPDDLRWETWWYYSQGGPGVFRGDLYFYSVDHDFREKAQEIDGQAPMYLLTGAYDFACTPEMTQEAASAIKNAKAITMEGIGHFPMCENPGLYRKYILPVLQEILGTEKRGAPARA